MKAYIQETIRDLNSEITRLQEMVGYLRRMAEGAPVGGGRPEAGPAEGNSERVAPRVRETPAMTVHGEGGPGRKENGQRTVEVARKLAQPFRAEDLVRAAGISVCNANGYIHRWKTKGWIVPESPGQYKRTADFGGVTARNVMLLEQIHAEIAERRPGDNDDSGG